MSKQLENWLEIKDLMDRVKESVEPLRKQYLKEICERVNAYEEWYGIRFNYNDFVEEIKK